MVFSELDNICMIILYWHLDFYNIATIGVSVSQTNWLDDTNSHTTSHAASNKVICMYAEFANTIYCPYYYIYYRTIVLIYHIQVYIYMYAIVSWCPPLLVNWHLIFYVSCNMTTDCINEYSTLPEIAVILHCYR